MDQVENKERKIARDKSAKFRGTACVRLEFLYFREKSSIDIKNVEIERVLSQRGLFSVGGRAPCSRHH